MKTRKITALVVTLAMILSVLPAMGVSADEGMATAFDTKALTVSGEVKLDGTGWNASENGASVRWNQNWNNNGTWASGAKGTYGLMFFASKARETGGGSAKATLADAARTLRSRNIDITFNFACQETENIYQRWNFYDNDNNVFATLYFDKNSHLSVGKTEVDVVRGQDQAYSVRGQEIHISIVSQDGEKYLVTYTVNGKVTVAEEVLSVNGFKAISADVPSYNDQWAAAALLNLKITYAPNSSVTAEEYQEYTLMNTAPVMSVSGGSETNLVDVFEPITMSHPAGEEYLYYTTDGTDPTTDSKKYEGPFHVGGVANIKACAITPNGIRSEIAQAWVYNRAWAATAAEFRIEGENTVNNVKIAWPLYPHADRYEVYRGDKLIGTTTGDAVDEYDLEINKNYSYTVKAFKGNELLAEGSTNTITTFAVNLDEISGYDDNRRAGWVPLITDSEPKPSGYNINGKYYQVKNEGVSRDLFVSLGFDGAIWDKGCTCVAFYYKESDDGFNWPEEWTPIYPVFIDMRFEGRQVGLHHDKETIVWSAHAEGTSGYGVAKLFFAAFKPGRDAGPVQPYALTVSGNVILPQNQPWEQYQLNENPGSNEMSSYYIGRPFGYDSRDMVRFSEGENFYTFSSTNMNQDMLILKLDENWTKPEKVMNVILKGQHQESPSVFHDGNAYFVYTSTTNGWFASQARYASSTALDEPWSPLRMVGNAGTFASQANGVWGYGSESGRWVQRGHGYNWGHSGGWRKSNYQIFYHMAINDGVATGNWCYKMEYHPYWGAIAVQSGETVSLGKKATVEGKVSKELTDNVQLMRTGVTDVQKVPYDIIVDLEVPTVVSEVNLTNDIYNGSNCGSYFKVYGSNDENNWEFLVDATSKDDDDPSFRSTWIETDKAYRYIKVEVLEVNNLQGGNQSALWGGKPLEVAIYGKPEGWVAENYDLSAQEEILVGYDRNNIDFEPYGQEPVIVNGRTLVPLRAIFEAMGAQVDWNEATGTVTAQRDGTTISLAIGSNQLYVNGEAKELDTPAQIINSRTMVPVRAIAESFGCDVNWNDGARRVYISEAE